MLSLMDQKPSDQATQHMPQVVCAVYTSVPKQNGAASFMLKCILFIPPVTTMLSPLK